MRGVRVFFGLMMLAGSGLAALAFVGAPNMANLLAQGPGYLLERSREHPLDGALFVLLPVACVAQLAIAVQLFRGRGGNGLLAVAAVLSVGWAALAIGSWLLLRNFQMH